MSDEFCIPFNVTARYGVDLESSVTSIIPEIDVLLGEEASFFTRFENHPIFTCCTLSVIFDNDTRDFADSVLRVVVQEAEKAGLTCSPIN